MVNLKSKLKIIDNSGGIIGKCIKIIESKKKVKNQIGNLILTTVIKKKKKKKFKKKSIYYGLIIMISQRFKRLDGTFIKFKENRILLLTKNYKFLGSRVYGVNLKEFKLEILKNINKKQKYLKILSYFKSVV